MDGLRWCTRMLFLLTLLAFYQMRAAVVLAAPAAAVNDSYCGDGTCDSDPCNDSQTPGDGCRETRETCPADCGWCGDGYCDPNYEDWTNCTQDCGSCGDGVCEIGSEADCSLPEHWCAGDCGPVQGACLTDCYEQTECGTNQICNPQHTCITLGSPETPGTKKCGDETGSCTRDTDCCDNGGNGEVCIGADGTKTSTGYCGAANNGVCPGSSSCFSLQDCYDAYSCSSWEGDGPDPCFYMYCDPNVGRCQFVGGPDGECPDPSTVYTFAPEGPICHE